MEVREKGGPLPLDVIKWEGTLETERQSKRGVSLVAEELLIFRNVFQRRGSLSLSLISSSLTVRAT